MTPRVANIFGILLILVSVVSCPVWAQSNPTGPSAPEKLDEFGAVGRCDMTARLDNFAIFANNTPGATLHIIAYGAPGEGPGATKRALPHLKDYLINTRGIDPDRITTVYGGRNSDLTEPKVQLWIIPPNMVPPEPEKFENNIATFKGKFFEFEPFDDFGVWYEYTSDMGPGVGRPINASLADILQQQKNAVAYIVAYNGAESLPGAWRRFGEEQVDRLKQFDVDASRVKIIFGGQKAESKVQLWVLPKDARPPVAEVERESFPKEVMKAGEISAEYLAYDNNQAQSFKLLADVLRTDKTVRAFLVVRLEAPPLPKSEVAKAEPVENQDPDFETPETPDLTKLVEKWRTDLTTVHKIRNDRIIVIFLPGTESDSNSIGLWFVPKGQPLPDPNKKEEEEEDPDPGIK